MWPEQEFLNAEAVIAGVADPKEFLLEHLKSNSREQLARAARADRKPKEIATVLKTIEHLKKLGGAAAEQKKRVRIYSGKKSENLRWWEMAKYNEAEWLERMRAECPGFSDWVYLGAINDFGFWATR